MSQVICVGAAQLGSIARDEPRNSTVAHMIGSCARRLARGASAGPWLRGAERVLLGCNTPADYPPVPQQDRLPSFHNHLVIQAGARQNGCRVVALAKAGLEEGCDLIGQSAVIAPSGETVAMCPTLGGALLVTDCDLERCLEIKENDRLFCAAPSAPALRTRRRPGRPGR